MAKSKRMFNSNIINASSFKMKMSNKAKLLYFYIMLNADDKGFCDNVDELIVLLDRNDMDFHNEASLDLVQHGYNEAIDELLKKDKLLKFENSEGDKVYLVKHWYVHNQIPKDRITETMYLEYLELVELNENNEYVLKQKPTGDAKAPKKAQKTPKTPVPSKTQQSDKETENEKGDYPPNDDGFDYSAIPSEWGFDDCSRVFRLHVMEANGGKLTPEQQRYLDAYKKRNAKASTKESSESDDVVLDDLPI